MNGNLWDSILSLQLISLFFIPRLKFGDKLKIGYVLKEEKRIQKIFKLVLAISVVSLIFFTACSKDKDKEVVFQGFELKSEDFSLESLDPIQVSNDAKRYTIDVLTASTVNWTYEAIQGSDFLAVSSSGKSSGEGKIFLAFSENKSIES